MALESKPQFLTGAYNETPSEYTYTRIWWVEGPELSTTYAGAAGPPYAVRNGPDIPAMGATYSPPGSSVIMRVSSRVGKRVAPDAIEVVVKYTYSKKSSGQTDQDALPEDEAARRFMFNVPYDEHLEQAGKEEKVVMGWNPDDITEPKLVNPFGGGAVVFSPRVIWAFTVLTNPIANDWDAIGFYANDVYPPVIPHLRRPFRFNANTLLYLGATGGIAKKGDGNIMTPAGVPQDWVWELTFRFAFNPAGWDGVDWYYYKTIAPASANPESGAWYDPYTKAENTGYITPGKLDVAFGQEFYDGVNGQRLLRPYRTAVMQGINFPGTLQFNWDWS